jgi:phosphate transport system ATP-binding protein
MTRQSENHPQPTADVRPETVAIAARNVRFFYGRHQILHDISLDIVSKKITAFIGPSGCGKSTLLRTFNRMYETVSGARIAGQIHLDGTDIRSMNLVSLRRKVGMVFQKSNPFPKSVFDNVAYGLRINRLCRRRELPERVRHSLVRAALWDEVKDKLHHSALSLSGGQQQRLCIARALALDPEVLLLDEPCSALDPIATSKIEDLLNQLRGTCSIVIVTHNMHQAARVSDYTAFLYLGRLIEYSSTDNIFQNPQSKQTEDYVTGRFG